LQTVGGYEFYPSTVSFSTVVFTASLLVAKASVSSGIDYSVAITMREPWCYQAHTPVSVVGCKGSQSLCQPALGGISPPTPHHTHTVGSTADSELCCQQGDRSTRVAVKVNGVLLPLLSGWLVGWRCNCRYEIQKVFRWRT
jgi:hypothetical protein